MSLKFHDYNGTEVRVPDSAAFAEMVRTKRILPDTLLFDDETGLWKRASDYPEYYSALSSSQNAAAASYGAPVLSGLASFGQPEEEETGRIWPLTLAVALLLGAMVIVGLTLIAYSRSPVEALTRLLIVIGGAMAAAVISFLVWLLLLRNRKDMGLLFFSCSFLVIALGHYAQTAREARSRKIAVERVGATMTELLNGNRVEASRIDEDVYGSSTPFVKLMSEYSAQISADFGEMKAEFEALHLDRLLTSETLQDEAHIDAGRTKLTSMFEILDRYEDRFRTRQDDVPSRVAASDMSESEKLSFIAGFNRSRSAGDLQLAEFFEIERALAEKTDETLEFVRSRRGRYRTVGNSIQFASRQDIELYNSHLQEITLLAEEESRWQARARDASMRGLSEFKKLAK
ncbi:MAG TPA: hypothetical protein VGV87_24505 [Blastocatellia bacterium]|nr:hypothetical protein [Blastocatellia bacterium]